MTISHSVFTAITWHKVGSAVIGGLMGGYIGGYAGGMTARNNYVKALFNKLDKPSTRNQKTGFWKRKPRS